MEYTKEDLNCVVRLFLDTCNIFRDNPEGTPEMHKAFVAGRKWAMKTYKRHGLDGINSRWAGMIFGTQRNETDVETMFRILGVFEAWLAYQERRTPPIWPDRVKETAEQLVSEIAMQEKTSNQPTLH
jgi:hypothetical protein